MAHFTVGRLLVNDLNAVSGGHGFSIADVHLPGVLMIEDPAPLRASDPAVALNVTNAVLSDRIGRVERNGLLARRRGADRRVFDLTITPEGAARVAAIGGALEAESRFAPLPRAAARRSGGARPHHGDAPHRDGSELSARAAETFRGLDSPAAVSRHHPATLRGESRGVVPR